jgi:hypothetical protein
MSNEVTTIDRYEPDYTKECEVCGTKHVVTVVRDGRVVYQGTMCGVCTWDEDAMREPSEWNK